MELTTSILAGVLAVAFLGAGGGKLAGAQQITSDMRGVGVGEGLQRTIGVLEVLAAAGLIASFFVEGTGIAAAAGLVLLMTGAVIYEVRADHGAHGVAPPAILGVLALSFVVLRLAL